MKGALPEGTDVLVTDGPAKGHFDRSGAGRGVVRSREGKAESACVRACIC